MRPRFYPFRSFAIFVNSMSGHASGQDNRTAWSSSRARCRTVDDMEVAGAMDQEHGESHDVAVYWEWETGRYARPLKQRNALARQQRPAATALRRAASSTASSVHSDGKRYAAGVFPARSNKDTRRNTQNKKGDSHCPAVPLSRPICSSPMRITPWATSNTPPMRALTPHCPAKKRKRGKSERQLLPARCLLPLYAGAQQNKWISRLQTTHTYGRAAPSLSVLKRPWSRPFFPV